MTGEPTALRCQRTIAADHPAFAGHFPGQPLLPGVLLLAEVLEALREAGPAAGQGGAVVTISAAKFLAPVRPGAVLDLCIEPGQTSRRFELRHGTQLVASGTLALA